VKNVGAFLLVLLALGAVAWWVMTQPFVTRRAVPRIDVDSGRLLRDVKVLAALAPRDAEHPKNMEKAAELISKALHAAGGEVIDLPFTVSGAHVRDVVASFGPQSASRVVVGAHYDAYGGFPGADDNASGVAGLLELARLLGEARLSSRVELAAYALEEPPWFGSDTMGSAVHARWLKDSGAKVSAMLSLEMIGCFSDEEGSQTLPLPPLSLFYGKRGDFIAVVGRVKETGLVRKIKGAMLSASDLPVRSFNAPQSFPAIDLSDHLSFWRAEFPAVMVTDTAYYRNPRYHTRNDTPETLDPKRMAKVVAGVLQAVLDLSGS
jgi:peptidase M28-like protein